VVAGPLWSHSSPREPGAVVDVPIHTKARSLHRVLGVIIGETSTDADNSPRHPSTGQDPRPAGRIRALVTHAGSFRPRHWSHSGQGVCRAGRL